MIIQSDFTQMLKLLPSERDTKFYSKETVALPIGDYASESYHNKFIIVSLPDAENWSNMITVKEFVKRESGVWEYAIVHQAEYSSPVHLKKALQELGVIA